MRIAYSTPIPAGSARAAEAKRLRDLATEFSRTQAQALTRANGEEADHSDKHPANFTKGLQHDDYGVLKEADDYRCFVEAINSPDGALFEKHVPIADADCYACTIPDPDKPKAYKKAAWRGWESPRAGHAYEMEGPDPGAVGMAPAPRAGSSELAAEMAEVYGLALLRDVPFTEICAGGGQRLCAGDGKAGPAELTAEQIVDLLKGMRFYTGDCAVSSTPMNAEDGYNDFEANRRFARTLGEDLTPANAFRGSTEGAQTGPYISQFMLVGAPSIAGVGDEEADFPGGPAAFDLQDGYIPYGSLIVDQRTISHQNCLDYMTDWRAWRDVQNGANFKKQDLFERRRRFITTPRDLATYVHFDALYEAYLNACLILLALGAKHSKGFPEPSPSGRRDAFATYGGPHILSLVTEVATRCLKAVRRQKFNYHRRARPEAIAGRLTVANAGFSCADLEKKLGCAAPAFQRTLDEIPADLQAAVAAHNKAQNALGGRRVHCEGKGDGWPGGGKGAFEDFNLLLPMAFPEGSPMHPAYGAGHATVAGGCVTMLKAFFEMFEDCDGFKERELRLPSKKKGEIGDRIVYVPTADGAELTPDEKFEGALTIQGELDKLAANISIGRNMAGVHYYSDYYDSLRMGERIAIGILMEQAPTYGETVEMTLKSFDGDYLALTGEAGSRPSLTVMDRDGRMVPADEWRLRHVSGQEQTQDY